MTMHTTNGQDGIAASNDIPEVVGKLHACEFCNHLSEELGAAMDRIEIMIVERDAARARVRELEGNT